jgi:hypothetical protein
MTYKGYLVEWVKWTNGDGSKEKGESVFLASRKEEAEKYAVKMHGTIKPLVFIDDLYEDINVE